VEKGERNIRITNWDEIHKRKIIKKILLNGGVHKEKICILDRGRAVSKFRLRSVGE
jgi:hypothetical protein